MAKKLNPSWSSTAGYVPYNTDSEGVEATFLVRGNDANRVLATIIDHAYESRLYEVTLTIKNGVPHIWFAHMRVNRGSGHHMRSITLTARLVDCVLAAYDRFTKIGVEPVVGDYINDGVRIVRKIGNEVVTILDSERDRVVWLGGGAIEWHKRSIAA